jgi:hypothetical protein
MKQKEWTIMIYMAGDNNLAVDNAYALGQIKEAAKEGAEKLNLFVYYDGNSPEIPTLYCDFSEPEPKYYRSFKVEGKLFKVPRKINENAADAKSILNFVDWCVNKVAYEDVDGKMKVGRRARRYALIFSGHSLGFLDKGLFTDESAGKSMKLNDLSLAIQRMTMHKNLLVDYCDEDRDETRQLHLEERDELLGKPLDILGFDSCVMGMLEVGYQFHDFTKTMIVSEGSVPSAGWTYAKILRGLACGNHAKESAKKVAAQFVKEFIESQLLYTIGGVSVDMAAWDMKHFDCLSSAFDELATVLIECFEIEDSVIYRQMERVILQVHWKCQSYMYDQNVDLGDFCDLLRKECASVANDLGGCDGVEILKRVQDACEKVLRELEKAVILSGFSGGGYQYSNGISVFFPWSLEGYEASKKNFQNLYVAKDIKNYNKDSGNKCLYWGDFLKKYLKDVARRKAEHYTIHALPGKKIRKPSGIKFSDQSPSELRDSQKQADLEGSKLAGLEGSKLAGLEGSKLAGLEGSKLAGLEGSKLAGLEGSKLAGLEGSKLAGLEGSKLAGLEGSKLAGLEGSKLAGLEGSKLAGLEGSKLAGLEGSKMGGAGSNALFNNLKLWKNIETHQDIYGFTKHDLDSEDDDSPGYES